MGRILKSAIAVMALGFIAGTPNRLKAQGRV